MYHFDCRRAIELLSSGCGKSRGGRRRRRCVFGAFYAATLARATAARRAQRGPSSLSAPPLASLAPSFIAAPARRVVSFGCCTVIMGPTDPLFYSLLAACDWAPNCPNPYDGLPKRERRERRVICVRSLRTQRAEESFRAEARRAWPLLQACTLPASVGATGGALSRCTVSEGEEGEEAGRVDASLITRRTEETIMPAGGSPTLTKRAIVQFKHVVPYSVACFSKLCEAYCHSFLSRARTVIISVRRSEFAAMKNEERGQDTQ